jgi:hypothetical protein
MINGDANMFIESVYNCQDIAFIYKGEKYWFQGHTVTDGVWGVHMECYKIEPPGDENVWQYDGSSLSEGQESFQNSPIFDGKSFWEVEKEIEWVDC